MAINSEFAGGPRSGVPETTRAALYETLKGRPMISIPILTLGASKILLGRPCLVCGFVLVPTGGAGVAVLYDGGDNTGTIVAGLGAASGVTIASMGGGEGVFCSIGLFFNWTSGNWTGSIWVKV